MAGLLSGWLGGQTFRRRVADIGYLFTGNLVASLVGLAAFGLTARALGPEQFGILALLHAYTRFIDKTLSFQSWQSLIKFGAEALARPAGDDLNGILRFGLLLDLTTAAIGTALAMAIALLAAPWFDWSPQTLTMLLFYCSVLLFRVQSAPIAVLRLFGRFRFFAGEQAVNAVIRLGLVSLGYWLGMGLWYFVVVWYAMQPLTLATLMTVAWRELRRRGYSLFKGPSVRQTMQRYQGILSFAWSTNLSLTIRTSTNELDTLLVGAFTDTAAAGFYHIAKRSGRIVIQLGVHAQAVLYPDMARTWVRREIEEFRRAVRQIVTILGGLGLVTVAVITPLAGPLLRLLAGEPFVAARHLLVIQTVAGAIYLLGLGLRPALLSSGRQQELLKITLWSALAFHATALLLLPQMGPMGANIAHLVSATLWVVGIALALRRTLGLATAAERAE